MNTRSKKPFIVTPSKGLIGKAELEVKYANLKDWSLKISNQKTPVLNVSRTVINSSDNDTASEFEPEPDLGNEAVTI